MSDIVSVYQEEGYGDYERIRTAFNKSIGLTTDATAAAVSFCASTAPDSETVTARIIDRQGAQRMRAFDSDTANYDQFGPVEVARWEQFDLDPARMPFSAMWYSVEPGASSQPDSHPEPELSVVVAGTAWVEIDGEVTEVRTGSSFLLDSNETHVVHNRSAQEKLTVFSAYWMPAEASDARLESAVTAGV